MRHFDRPGLRQKLGGVSHLVYGSISIEFIITKIITFFVSLHSVRQGFNH